MKSSRALPQNPDFLHRPRVGKLLQQGIGQPLMRVIAGVGYGKTQAVAAFLAHRKERVVWTGLLSLDNTPDLFWGNLVRAVGRELPHLAQQLGKMEFPASNSAYSTFLHLLAQQVYDGPQVVWVVDNYSTIAGCDEVRRFFRAIVEAQLENFCLILISDERLPESSDALRIAEGIFTLTEQDLRFDAEETLELFAFRGIPLSDDDLAAVIAETDGWALALHLISEQFQRAQPDITRLKDILSLVDELFEYGYFRGYEPHVQTLLVKLSLLPAFAPEIVRDLSRQTLAPVMRLVGDHMFITWDEGTGLYTFQKPYHDFLSSKQAMLRADEAETVYKSGADWAYGKGRWLDAVLFYRKAEDSDGILDAVEKLPVVRRKVSDSDFLLDCLQTIPAQHPRYPAALFYIAFQYFNKMQIGEAKAHFERLRDTLEQSGQHRAMLGNAYLILADIAFLESSDAFHGYFQKAGALLPQGSDLYSPDFMYVGNNGVFFLPQNAPGQLEYVVGRILDIRDEAERLCNGCGYGFEHLFQAEGAYYTGDFDAAKEHCYNAVYKAQKMRQHDIVCNGWFLLMRMALLRGDYPGAKENLEKLTAHIDSEEIVYLYDMRDCAQNWFYLMVNDLDRVGRWLAGSVFSPELFTLDPVRSKVIRVRYLIAKGQTEEALAILTQEGVTSMRHNSWSIRLVTHILAADCHMRRQAPDNALDTFSQAYSMAYGNDITMLFVEFSGALRDIIALALEDEEYGFDSAWLRALDERAEACEKNRQAAADDYRRQGRGGSTRGVQLTPRDIDVLRQMAAGLSREQIAQKLNMSISGVKKHITAIFNKLGAMNRVEALNIAADMGYIKSFGAAE